MLNLSPTELPFVKQSVFTVHQTFFYFNGLFFIVFFRFCPEYYAAVFMPFVLSGFYVVHLLLLLKSSVDNSKLVSSLNKWQFLLHLYQQFFLTLLLCKCAAIQTYTAIKKMQLMLACSLATAKFFFQSVRQSAPTYTLDFPGLCDCDTSPPLFY